MKHFAAASAIAIAALSVATWSPHVLAQQAATTQTTVVRSVTVKVTPGKLADSGWEFFIVLDTHSEDLKDDLEKSAVLVVDGQEIRPVQWQGPAASGHHREGVLRFPAPKSRTGAIELKLARAGESAPRVFRWEGLQPQ
jgi:hypothetical protein